MSKGNFIFFPIWPAKFRLWFQEAAGLCSTTWALKLGLFLRIISIWITSSERLGFFVHLSHCARKWKKNGLLFFFSFTFLISLCVCLFISLCVCLFETFFLRKISFLQKIKLNMNFLFYSILKLSVYLHKTSPRQHAREAIVKSLHNSISGIHIIFCSVLRETHEVEINFVHLQGAYNLFIYSINTVITIFDRLPCAKL